MAECEARFQQDEQVDINLESVYKSIEGLQPGRKQTRADDKGDNPQPFKRARSNPLPPKREIDNDDDADFQTRKRACSASISREIDSSSDSNSDPSDDSDGSPFLQKRKSLFERILDNEPSCSRFKVWSRDLDYPAVPAVPAVHLTQPSREASPSQLTPSNLEIQKPEDRALLSPIWGPWKGFKRNYGESRQLLAVERAHHISYSRCNSPDHTLLNPTTTAEHLQEANTRPINPTQVDYPEVGSSGRYDLEHVSLEEDGVVEYTTWDGSPPDGWATPRSAPKLRNTESSSSEDDDLEDRSSEDDYPRESRDSPRSPPELGDTESGSSEDHHLGDSGEDARIAEEGLEYQESEDEELEEEDSNDEYFNNEECDNEEPDNEESGNEDSDVWKGSWDEGSDEESADEQSEDDDKDSDDPNSYNGEDSDGPDSNNKEDSDGPDFNKETDAGEDSAGKTLAMDDDAAHIENKNADAKNGSA